jgi:hypothetical protein
MYYALVPFRKWTLNLADGTKGRGIVSFRMQIPLSTRVIDPQDI